VHHPRLFRHRSRGQMLPLFALTLSVFIGALVLGVDLTHVRADAENAQRAANAAALAGAVFLPNYPTNASERAMEVLRGDGFDPATNPNIQVAVAPVPTNRYRLSVKITMPIELFFGHPLGIGPQTISRSAIGEYLIPIELGTPDNVLGYAPFPTNVAPGTPPENFYLENKGPYTLKESGDAYSPYFESYCKNSDPTKCKTSNTTPFGTPPNVNSSSPNPCPDTSPTTPPHSSTDPSYCPLLTPNQKNAHQDFKGYNYIIDVPVTQTLAVRLFDPYDENSFNNKAHSYNSAVAPDNIKPSNAMGKCIIGPTKTSCQSEFIDQNNCTSYFTGGCATAHLQFSLYGGHQYQAPETTMTQVTDINSSDCQHTDCVYQQMFDAGDDPSPCSTVSCPASQYAYRFMTYAVIHGPGVWRLNVLSAPDTGGTYTVGNRGNAYGIAVCAEKYQTAPPALTDTPGLTWSPFDPNSASTTPAWDQTPTDPNTCLSPNSTVVSPATTPICTDPLHFDPATENIAGHEQCVHVYAESHMSLHNWLGAGAALVPLAYIGPSYAGKTLDIRMYDVGDVDESQGAASSGNGMCPGNPTVISCLQILDPAGDLQLDGSGKLTHADGKCNDDGGKIGPPANPACAPTGGSNGYPSTLPFSFSAAEDAIDTTKYPDQGYKKFSSPSSPSTGVIDVSHATYNGTWLDVLVTVPDQATYQNMVAHFGAYWKVLYRIGDTADDGTTWEVSVAGSPTHLVTP